MPIAATVNPLAGCADLPAMIHLARALWRTEGARGAAVLVGAGFSREARLSSADLPPPPLWSDLARAMRAELYPTDPSAAPWDPLRLAEEYRSYFGQAALDAFIREHIRDDAWYPAERHASLVDLPWSDILTTNHDTLIERAARNCDRAYDPVRSEAEIASAKAPRIIKLHGSIATSDHFVIAEEDFRAYPARHAAFVNLARQCFVENELCLIGFSGDDPNFLAWAGWVRDHLGSSARRIYLAGALNLSPAKRKYLEARNIAPIDVYPLVEELERPAQHAAANRLILDALHALAPAPAHGWEPERHGAHDRESDHAAQHAHIQLTIERWTEERRRYPGWLICPSGKRSSLRFATEMPTPGRMEEFDPSLAARGIFEWCWRHQTALWPIHPFFIQYVRRFADPISTTLLPMADRLLVASVLLQYARRGAEAQLFAEMAAFIEANSTSGSDVRADLRYQQALAALGDLDLVQSEVLSAEIVGEDPAWLLRRAAILAALGQFDEASRLVDATLADLRERERLDRSSIWVRSRVAWALFVQRLHSRGIGKFEPWPERFRETRCDPWQEIETALRDASSERRKRHDKPQRPMPNFEPGSFKLPSRTLHFGDTRIEPSDAFSLLLEQGGLPPRFEMVTFYIAERLDALELCYEPTLEWYLSLLRVGLNKGEVQLQRYFARVAIAALDHEVVSGLVDRIKRARDYWAALLDTVDQSRRVFARDRLLTLLELLSRLTVRLDDDHAIALHLETLALNRQLGNQLRYGEALGNLLANSFETVTPAARAPMVVADLGMPLVGDDGIPEPTDWIGKSPLHQPQRNKQLRGIVVTLLEAAGGAGGERRAAISRLTALHVNDALTPSEVRRFARAAWARLDQGDPPLPADTQVFPHYWAKLPVVGKDVPALLRQRVFAAEKMIDQTSLSDMIRTVRAGAAAPDPAQARERFDTIVALRFKPVDQKDFVASFDAGLRGYDHIREANFAGAALTWALAPHLAAADRTAERLTAIDQFAFENGTYSASGAMVPFLTRLSTARGALTTVIRRGLTMQDIHQVGYACDALRIWLEEQSSGTKAAPEQLVEQLVSIIELRQSPGLWRLLESAAWLERSGRIDAAQRARIETALGDLLTETEYIQIDPLSEQGGTVPMVREHAVKLAVTLRDGGHASEVTTAWIACARNDPLPEVRHAIAAPADAG